MNALAKLGQISSFGQVNHFFSLFALACAFIASLVVFSNDAYYFFYHGLTPSVVLLLLALIVGLSSEVWGLSLVICLLPLTAGLSNAIKVLFDANVLAIPNLGLDLVAGLLLAHLIKGVMSKFQQYRLLASEFNSWVSS